MDSATTAAWVSAICAGIGIPVAAYFAWKANKIASRLLEQQRYHTEKVIHVTAAHTTGTPFPGLPPLPFITCQVKCKGLPTNISSVTAYGTLPDGSPIRLRLDRPNIYVTGNLHRFPVTLNQGDVLTFQCSWSARAEDEQLKYRCCDRVVVRHDGGEETVPVTRTRNRFTRLQALLGTLNGAIPGRPKHERG